jgi:hypothetical protein
MSIAASWPHGGRPHALGYFHARAESAPVPLNLHEDVPAPTDRPSRRAHGEVVGWDELRRVVPRRPRRDEPGEQGGPAYG